MGDLPIFVSGFSEGHLRRRGSFPAVQAGSRYQKLHLKRHFRSVLIKPTCKYQTTLLRTTVVHRFVRSLSVHYVQHGVAEPTGFSSSGAQQIKAFRCDQRWPNSCHIQQASFSHLHQNTSNYSFKLSIQAEDPTSSSPCFPCAI